MNVTIRQLRAFIAGLNSSSFSEAAQKIGLTQPGFSLLIRQLEDELGERLFDRTTRKISATPAGLQFRARVEPLLEQLDSACAEIKELKQKASGFAKVGVVPTVASTITADVCHAVEREYPDVKLSVQEFRTETLLSKVARGEVDFGVGPDLGETGDLRFSPIFNDRFVGIFKATDELLKRDEIRWRDLTGKQLVSVGTMTRSVRYALGDMDIDLEAVHETSYVDAAVSLVRSGLGYTLIGELSLRSIDMSGLGNRIITQPVAHRRMGLFTISNKTPTTAAAAVMTIFRRIGSETSRYEKD